MPKCYDQDFPCQEPSYGDFDDVANAEMRNPPSANEIINESEFCTFVPIDEAIRLGDLTYHDYLKGLRSKIGLYHLWVEYDNCDDHETHTLLCVYVGKGLAEARIKSHIKEKWPHHAQLYVSFYECNNRTSKYLEQLFLDTYSFYLNKYENSGTKSLFAVWDFDRYLLGTEIYTASNQSNISSFEDP